MGCLGVGCRTRVQASSGTLPSLLRCHFPPELANALRRHSVYFITIFSSVYPRTRHAVASQYVFYFSKMKRGRNGENDWKIFLILILFKSRCFPAHLEHWLSTGILDITPKCSSVWLHSGPSTPAYLIPHLSSCLC